MHLLTEVCQSSVYVVQAYTSMAREEELQSGSAAKAGMSSTGHGLEQEFKKEVKNSKES